MFAFDTNGIQNIYITAQLRAPDNRGRISMTTEFELSVNGSSKDLLDSIAVLADQDINLNTIATAKADGHYVIKFITGSEDEVRRTFIKADLPFKEKRVLIVEVHNRPGMWVKAAHHLVDGGVQLEASYLLGQHGDKLTFVFVVDNYERAKKIAGQITNCSMD